MGSFGNDCTPNHKHSPKGPHYDLEWNVLLLSDKTVSVSNGLWTVIKRKRAKMEENTQVLDVTYGNFSCRLEGFADSVETMKLVVSFFHELSGHDRFLDTEPLAPNLDELARLTKAQTGVAVDIEGDGSRVSLRARPDDADATPAEAEVDEVVAEDETVVLVAQHDTAEAITQDDADTPDAVHSDDPTSQDDDASDTDNLSRVADKLERMRAAAETKNAPDTDEFAEDLSAAEETIPAADPLSDRLSDLVKRATATAAQDALDDNTPAPQPAVDESENETEDLVAELLFAKIDDEASEDESEIEGMSFDSETEPEKSIFDLDDDDDETFEEVQTAPAKPQSAPLILTAEQAVEATDTPVAADDDDAPFDLEAEVAKVEAELAAHQGKEWEHHGLPRHVEDAMSRIMSQTDQHLNQPENRRHRDAFAQLKAAVAATEAARLLGDKGAKKRDPDEVYKDDLGAHDAQEKNETQAAPPLKLVQSQEIKPNAPTLRRPERPTPAAAGSMEGTSARLRQIATLKEADAPSETRDFASFAAHHGADDLTDKLEAAGAYLCLIDGEEDFSRPQVMRMVQSTADTEISREDGLRSFGRLLRQARLVKLSNGRFKISENTKYRPDGSQTKQG